MSTPILTIEDVRNPDDLAQQVIGFWDITQQQRLNQVQRWDEIRQYIYATDTDHTTGPVTPWKNKTTRPKLTFLYDKMKTTYIQKLLPNDEFFRWKGAPGSNFKDKAKLIQHLMVHKLKHPDVAFRATVADCLMDFLQCGNAFAGVEYIRSYQKSYKTKTKKLVFKGAKPYRIDPRDVGMNPTAATYKDSYVIHRIMMTREQFYQWVQDNPKDVDMSVVDKLKAAHAQGGFNNSDIVEAIKAKNRAIDGVSLYDHWQSGNVELIEFFGPLYNSKTGEYKTDQRVVVADRMWPIINTDIDSFIGIKPIVFAGFRKRPETIWCMGPLENLVGMQYRIDHIENAKADALDLCIYPIIKVTGDATDSKYKIQPGEQWFVPLNGDVELIYPDPRTLMFENEIMSKEQEMEEFAAVPRETAGFRTPGEKTKYEVGALLENASELSDERVAEFESQFIEPLLNLLLELTIINLDEFDLTAMRDEDQELWATVSEDDLKQDGRLYPVGSKQAKARAMKVQNVMQLVETASKVAPEHISKFAAMQVLNEEMGLEEDAIIGFGLGVQEAAKLAAFQQQVQDQFSRENPDASTDPSASIEASREAAS